jgi:hypothetical protein
MVCSGATSICMQEILVQGAYIFKKWVFNKSNSMMAWKTMQLIGPNSRYACVEKFRVIIRKAPTLYSTIRISTTIQIIYLNIEY